MRIVLALFIGIHGMIHLLGFLKAFGISDFDGIAQPVSKTFGIAWLVNFILFAVIAALIIAKSSHWWILGIIGVVLSQFLIINFWSDAKFGTLANVIILLAVLLAYSSFSFKNTIQEERNTLFKNSQLTHPKTVTKEDLTGLPSIVQKWLNSSGVIGKELTANVHLDQELQLKMKPEQTTWNQGEAEQCFTVHPPAFNWSISTQMNSILKVGGRDKFVDGKGEMTIKLFSLIPVGAAKDHPNVNQASLQRYLAEIVWFPSAALSPYIQWDTVDAYSAKATMEVKGTKGSGVFHFDEQGNFKEFVAMRYKDVEDSKPTKWTVSATKTELRNGIKIPVECEASWELEQGKWTWLKLSITDIQYNLEELPQSKL